MPCWRRRGGSESGSGCATPERATARGSALDERLQPAQRLVPLQGYAIEIALDAVDRLRPELVVALAPDTHAFHDPGMLQHAKMLADRLPRELRTRRQAGDRLRRTFAELCNQRQSCLVAQCGKDGRMSPSRLGKAACLSTRHDARCSPSAPPNRP